MFYVLIKSAFVGKKTSYLTLCLFVFVYYRRKLGILLLQKDNFSFSIIVFMRHVALRLFVSIS
jgi:hypothetical protein